LLKAGGGELREAMEEARILGEKHFGRNIHFYAPGFTYYKTEHFRTCSTTFPSISLTGPSCSLKCKHCDGVVLNTMYPANSPGKLVELCRELKSRGAVGCLVSGGCAVDGSMPIDRFTNALAAVKREVELSLVVHTGLIGEGAAQRLKEAGIDAALIDVIGSDETIKEICNLDVGVEDYEESLRSLSETGIPVVPHVLVGLHYGALKGELDALDMIARHNPSAVIVIAFFPIRGTAMEKTAPPPPSDITRVLVAARLKMPSTPLALGCMRPKGAHRAETDVLAVKMGVNAIAFPAKEAVEAAERFGYSISFSPTCCSQIFRDFKDRRV
jgi:uncharacterized radical SAM superfamily protein